MYLLGWIANRANNTMLTDPVFAPGIFNAANGFEGNFTTTPGLDLRRPEVFAHFKNRLRDNFVKRGMRGFKIDRGEQGEVPAALQNELAVLTAKAAHDATADVLGTEGFTFGRNVYDRARKYVAVWNGDSSSTFAGMSDSLKQLLRLGAIMYSMVSSDTGGYGRAPNAELFARWLALSAYSPMMQVLLGPNRTIWNSYNAGPNANPQLPAIARTFAQEHHDLIPYTRSMVYASTQTGMPAMRMMPFAFPNDPAVADMFDEYMFGDALLIAPVLTAGATSRSVYLPRGCVDRLQRQEDAAHRAGHDHGQRPARRGSALRESRGDRPARGHPEVEQQLDAELGAVPSHRVLSGRRRGEPLRVLQRKGRGGDDRLPVGTTVSWQAGNLGINGVLEVHNVDRYTSVRRNNQTLGSGDFQYNATTQVMTIPLRGATSVQIRR